MCGIAGILGWKNTNTIARMLDKQKHRGPDGRGIWVLPHQRFSVGHDRLAIIDVTTGMQPTSNEDNSLWLVMNGEIYNYESLREQLEDTHTFRSQSDSEVVLHLFEDRGPSCVEKLCGMYSFAIWGVDLGLYLARDPLGIKPLYYGYDKENNFYFSSEIKALIDHVSTIKEFPNGFYCLNSNNFVKYYEVPTPQKDLNSPQEVMNALDHALNEAVKNRLIADVPVGTFLSGGLDSSLITKIAKKYTDKPLNSFSIGLESSSDLLNARKVAKHIGTLHHEYILTPEDIYQSLPHIIKFLESCDPALVRSSIPTYFVSKLASQYVKVVLSGEGADELFAGYHYLEDFEKGKGLSNELWEITTALHNTNLQRVDRMTMAHGLEARVPFLDLKMIELAFKVNPLLKYREKGKWILRKLAERYLPPSIAWRSKEKFAIGTGIGSLLQNYAENTISDEELTKEKSLTGYSFRSKEEYLYWSLFKVHYGREDILDIMGQSRSLNPGEHWISAL